jgi:2-methylisocitrate lyase-like PEP mutase family enzyme
MKPTTKLRELLKKPGVIVMPGSFSAMSAKLVEDAGFESVYMSGGCTSMSFTGWADVGLITFDEMLLNVRLIVDRVNIPVVADADTGYGNALNLMRTTQAYIRAGAAAMHVEDQTLPKRCGNLPGKLLVSREEFVGKIRAAKDVINKMDPDFVFIARTDARNSVDGSLQEAIGRANLYAESGADVVLPDGLQSPEEVATFAKSVKAPTMVFTGYGSTFGSMSSKELEAAGVKIMAMPGAQFSPALYAQIEALKLLKKHGTDMVYKDKEFKIREMFDLSGLQEYKANEEKYLPREEMEKYKKSGPGI